SLNILDAKGLFFAEVSRDLLVGDTPPYQIKESVVFHAKFKHSFISDGFACKFLAGKNRVVTNLVICCRSIGKASLWIGIVYICMYKSCRISCSCPDLIYQVCSGG